MLEVPVKIDDNGRIYQTIFYAGISLPTSQEGTSGNPPIIGVSHDWALIDATNCKEHQVN